nr:hypothetical protein Iba_chr05cCG18610 [Ipomoea batatas]GME09667.1 hypothetical protein Iba_scaffold8947CG0370 [Ipomoea batatas]
MPFSVPKVIETKAITNFHWSHCPFHVLFVSKNQDDCIKHKRISDDNLKLLFGLSNSLSVQRIEHNYQSICVVEVMPPKWP